MGVEKRGCRSRGWENNANLDRKSLIPPLSFFFSPNSTYLLYCIFPSSTTLSSSSLFYYHPPHSFTTLLERTTTNMPIRLSSSARRDLSLIACCSLILILLVEFRHGYSSTKLDRSNGDYYATGPASSPEAAASLEGLDAEERELLGVPASSPRRSKHRSSGPSRLKSHHKHASSSRTKPATFDTHDNKIGLSRVSWGRDEGMPLTDLVAHAPG